MLKKFFFSLLVLGKLLAIIITSALLFLTMNHFRHDLHQLIDNAARILFGHIYQFWINLIERVGPQTFIARANRPHQRARRYPNRRRQQPDRLIYT